MSKFSKLSIIILVLILGACNRPIASQPPIDIEVTQAEVQATDLPDQPTDTSQPSDTDVPPPEEDPTPQPPPPTEDPLLNLPEVRLPLLTPGTEITMREVVMLNTSVGWGVAFAGGGIGHVLKTGDGGSSWGDITPPEPLNAGSSWFYPVVDFSDINHGYVTYPGSDLVWSTSDGGLSWHPSRLEYTTVGGALITSLGQDHAWLFQFLDAGMQKVYTALYATTDGGRSWNMLLDPTTSAEHSIQGFDKTGADFYDPNNGILTRFFRGVTPFVNLDLTRDGGSTWEPLEVIPPHSAPDAFNSCACGYYDPDFWGNENISIKLECQCFLEGGTFSKNYLYNTTDGGENWVIQSIPEGQLNKISASTYFVIGREIYKSTDAGENWGLVKNVNWDGQFSFADENTALGIAYDPDNDVYALVKTTDGCQSFQIITPQVIEPYTSR